MKTPPDAQELRELGLEGFVLRGEALLPGPAGAVGRGRSALSEAPTAERLRELVGLPDFRMSAVDLPLLQDARLGLERGSDSPHLLRAWSEAGEPLDAVAPGAPDACWTDADDEHAWFADLSMTGRVAFAQPSSVVLVTVTGAGLHAAWFAPEAPEEIVAPVASWLSGCSDPWLVERLASQDLGSSWVSIVAAADLVRLRQDVTSPARGSVAPARAWARGLSADRLAAVDSMAASEAELLHDAVNDVFESVAPTDDAWVEALQGVLVRRDQLEGVRVLLLDARIVNAFRAAPPDPSALGGRLDSVLEALDEQLRPLLESLPRGVVGAGERWRRVLRDDPSAWWARASETA